MLLAEIHGKYDLAVRDDEDYLTSTVFGHLRYIPPGPFWTQLFASAKTVTDESLTAVLGETHRVESYTALQIHFWPSCPEWGQPELAMCFTGGTQRPLVVLVEVKLWSGKSGHAEHDQLMRYLKIADCVGRLRPAVPEDARAVVVYLTPREATGEVQDSLNATGSPSENSRRLFRLRWQDMVDVIVDLPEAETAQSRLILEDVLRFLRIRGLEYFDGFHRPSGVELLREGCGSFYGSTVAFHGFRAGPCLSAVRVVEGEWCHVH